MQLRSRTSRPAAFTLMEILVVIAIIVVIGSIAYPVYRHFQLKGAKTDAIASFKKLSEGLLSYTAANGGVLPNEDAAGKDRWNSVKSGEAQKAWYNAVPKHLGMKNVGDFTTEGNTAAFYTKENLFYLPGAQYPDSKIERPLFALAFNSRLVRPVPGAPTGPLKLTDVIVPGRTVMFMEQGLPGEPKAHESIGKKDYDGAPKGSAKSFVTRYSGKVGIVSFFDGHVEDNVKAATLLTPTGAIAWSPESGNDSSAFLWTADPKVDPNISKQ